MHPKLATATLLASLIAGVISSPTAKPNTQVRIDQVAGGKVWRSGPVAKLQTLEKFGVTPSAALISAAARATKQKGKVAANPSQYDVEYLSPVKVGSSTTRLKTVFDTGSSDFWVFSDLQPSSQTTGHTVYNTTGSQQGGETWSIKYGDNTTAAGVVYADSVAVGKATLTSATVEVATSVSTGLTQRPYDGVVGLAFDSDNQCKPNKCQTLFDTFAPTLAQPIFTAALKHKAPGVYTLGYIDKSLYTTPISYVPVDNSQGYWGFHPGGFSYGSGTPTSGNITASVGGQFSILDTGTTLLYLPDVVVEPYYRQNVSGAEYSDDDAGWIFPCTSTLPDLNIKIGGQVFTVPGSYLNFAPADESGYCFGGLQSDDNVPFPIFGDIFIKSVYIVFEPDYASGPRIGFAKPK